jgi:hypothetical protein
MLRPRASPATIYDAVPNIRRAKHRTFGEAAMPRQLGDIRRNARVHVVFGRPIFSEVGSGVCFSPAARYLDKWIPNMIFAAPRSSSAEGRRIVQQQKGRIIRLMAAGVDTWDAQRALHLFEVNLNQCART